MPAGQTVRRGSNPGRWIRRPASYQVFFLQRSKTQKILLTAKVKKHRRYFKNDNPKAQKNTIKHQQMVPFSLGTVGLRRAQEGLPGPPPGPPTPLHVTLDRRHHDVLLLFRKQRRLEPELALEGREVSSGGLEGVVRIFRPRKPQAPGGSIVCHQCPQNGLELLIQPLHLPVGLGVETGGETVRRPDDPTERTPHPEGKLGSSVGHYILREAENTEHMVKNEFSAFKSGWQFRKRKKTTGL